MIKFTDLKVSNGHLIINAEVKQIEDYYDNVYIQKIKIDTQDTYASSGPSSNLIYESTTYSSDTKSISIDLTATDFSVSNIDMNKTMFFVYAVAGGSPAEDTPCGMDNVNSLGVTFSMCPIYNETMQYVKEVENTCELPKAFINKILQLKAIQYSINSGHYTQAIEYYNKFYKNLNVNPKTCGCNG